MTVCVSVCVFICVSISMRNQKIVLQNIHLLIIIHYTITMYY